MCCTAARGTRRYARSIRQHQPSVFAATLLLVAGSWMRADDRSQTRSCGTAPQTGWLEYFDKTHGFCFYYPPAYRIEPSAAAESQGEGKTLVRFVSGTPRRADAGDKGGASIVVSLLPGRFQHRALTRYAPTGETRPPAATQLGTGTFYYYGPGGGGIAYPDTYYFNLRGLILRLVFDGPYNREGKSPTAATQALEHAVLSSFRLARGPQLSAVLCDQLPESRDQLSETAMTSSSKCYGTAFGARESILTMSPGGQSPSIESR